MRRLAFIAVLLGTVPVLGSCSLFRKSDGLDLAADCQARMVDADPVGSVSDMKSDVRPTTFRTDVYVTGTLADKGGSTLDHFHCVYSGDALLSDDRKPAPPATAGTPDPAGTPAPAAAGGPVAPAS